MIEKRCRDEDKTLNEYWEEYCPRHGGKNTFAPHLVGVPQHRAGEDIRETHRW